MAMAHPAIAAPPSRVEFDRTKYGRELLLDAATVAQMPGFITSARPHVLMFHDILLLSKGRGHVLLDGVAQSVAPGTVVFSLPGQIREWRLRSTLDGACLFFAEGFVVDTFSDPRFLEQFAFFRRSRASGTLVLDRRQQRDFGSGFAAMRREVMHLRRDANATLRAELYRMLVLLNRWYGAQHGASESTSSNRFVERFRRLVDRDYARCHRLAVYADKVGVSPGHLNALCNQHAASSASAIIRARIVTEARRLLLYTELPAAHIGAKLGFEDPAYFARFFRRETGAAPTRFRAMSRSPAEPKTVTS